MKTKIKFLILLFLGIFVFNWVYEVFSGEKAISLLVDVYYLVLLRIQTYSEKIFLNRSKISAS